MKGAGGSSISKEEKMLKMQKKMFDNNIQKYNVKIQNMEQIIKEKDKELKMQANKIKELVYSGNSS
jgi:hypothetical protein